MKITFKGHSIETSGTLPQVGTNAPDFCLVRQDLSEATLKTFEGKKKILSIFPSVDTSVCSLAVKTFHEKAKDCLILHISKDLPFAQKRFCGAEGLDNVEMLSAFRSSFAIDYGLEIATGPLKGLCSRAIIVLDGQDKVIYIEQVPEVTQEPDYDRALEVFG